MSIATAITAAQGRVADAYTAISNKGGTLPATQNLSNMPTAIASIPSGGTKYGVGIDDLLGNTVDGTLSQPSAQFTVDLSGVTTIDSYALEYKFYRLNVQSADLSDVVTIKNYGLSYTFYRSEIESIDVSKVSSVETYGMYYAFAYSKLKSLYLPQVTQISSSSSIYYCCYSCDDLEYFGLPNLITVGASNALAYACQDTRKLKKVDLDSLTTISGSSGLSSFCSIVSSPNSDTLKYVNFKSLSTLSGSGSLSSSFQRRDKIYLYFPSLTVNSFGSNTNQFNTMLSNANNAYVFFPSAIENTIGSWASVTSGFGGNNTTVVFYIPASITVNITQDNAELLAITYNDEENVIRQTNSTINFVVYQPSENRAYLGNETNCAEGELRTVNVNMTSYTYNTISITPSINAPIKCLFGGVFTPMQENSGVYSLKINQSTGVSVPFGIKDNPEYEDSITNITTTGSDISQSLTTITPRTYVSWTRPDLTANGTLGGDSFAVAVSSINGSNYGYYAVDNSSSTYWVSSSVDTSTYTVYNPKFLKVSSFVITWRGTSYRATTIVLEGSQDNETWDSIQTYTPASAGSVTLDITTPKGYKYYRFTFTRANTYVGISNLAINATESST